MAFHFNSILLRFGIYLFYCVLNLYSLLCYNCFNLHSSSLSCSALHFIARFLSLVLSLHFTAHHAEIECKYPISINTHLKTQLSKKRKKKKEKKKKRVRRNRKNEQINVCKTVHHKPINPGRNWRDGGEERRMRERKTGIQGNEEFNNRRIWKTGRRDANMDDC